MASQHQYRDSFKEWGLNLRSLFSRWLSYAAMSLGIYHRIVPSHLLQRYALMSEAELLRFTLDALATSTLVHWRMPIGGVRHTFGKKMVMKKSPVCGFPDVCGLTHEGTFFGIELKSESGRVSLVQSIVQEKLRGSNAFITVARNPEDVLTFIENIGGQVKALAKAKASK